MAPLRGLSRIIAGLTLVYNLSFSDSLNINLDNVNKTFNFRVENDSMVYENPEITSYSQIEGLVKQVYKNLTGKDKLPSIRVADKDCMRKVISNSSNLYKDGDYPEIFSSQKDSLYIEQGRLRYLMGIIAHGLGHYSTPVKEGNNLEDRIMEEAKAISFDGAWSEELSNYILIEKDGSTRGIILGRITYSPDKESELYVADQIVVAIKKERNCKFKEVYETIINSDEKTLIGYIKDNPVYRGLKDRTIRPKAYKSIQTTDEGRR